MNVDLSCSMVISEFYLINGQQPNLAEKSRMIERAKQMCDSMHLAIQTDSTRLITYTIGDSSLSY